MLEDSPGVDNLRVLFVLWQGRPGGAELHTARLAAELHRRGHDVRVLTIAGGEAVPAELAPAGVPFASLDADRGRGVLLRAGKLRHAVSWLDPHVVVLPSNGILSIVFRAQPYGGVLLAAEHGRVLNRFLMSPRQAALDWLARLVAARLVDGEVAVSEVAREGLRRLPHSRVMWVIHNGVDCGAFAPPRCTVRDDARIRVGIAARLVDGKGVDGVIRALGTLGRDGLLSRHTTLLSIAGDGPRRAAFESAAQSLPDGVHVRFLGHVKDMPAFWRDQDIGVFASDRLNESFGLAGVEAASCGCRLVMLPSAAATEVFEGCPGLHIAAAQPDGLPRAIEAAMHDGPPTYSERVATHEWTRKRYSLSKTASAYEAFFRTLVEAKRYRHEHG